MSFAGSWDQMSIRRTALAALTIFAALAPPAQAVVGGGEATPGAYPWMIALVDAPLADANAGQFCGATLIAPTMALTAAHCVEEASARDVHVVIGRHRLSDPAAGQRIAVAAIASHPQVDLPNLRNDVALLRLASPAAGTPVRLVAAGDEGFWTPGAIAKVMGWGQLHANRPYVPDPLFETNVPIVADSDCTLAYGRFFDARSMICAGGGTPPGPVPDTCNGDSGGPLVVSNGSAWLHIGATSGATSAASRASPASTPEPSPCCPSSRAPTRSSAPRTRCCPRSGAFPSRARR